MALAGRRYDTSPIGTGKNWVTKADPVEGLGAFVHAVVHALMRDGHPEGEAIAIAEGVMKRWAAGVGTGGPHNKTGKVTAKTQAKAAAAVAHWEELKARAHARAHNDRRAFRQDPAPGTPVTEAGSSAAALLPRGIPPAQAKAVQKKMGGGDPDQAHAFRGGDLTKCSLCGQPLSSAIHRTTKEQADGAQAVPPVSRQAKLIIPQLQGKRALTRASGMAEIARARATRPARGAIHELGIRWHFNPKQPRIHGKWSGPSAIEVAEKAQSKSHLAFIKAWGADPEMHDAVKKHVDTSPNITAAGVKLALIAEGKEHLSNYSHVLTTVKQVKAEKAAAKAAGIAPPKAGPIGFNGSGHVGFGGTEALGVQAANSGDAVKWFKPGDKVYGYVASTDSIVSGTVHHTSVEGDNFGRVHVQVAGHPGLSNFNAARVAHKDVIDSLDKKALQLHSEHSNFKGVKYAFMAASKHKEPAAPPEPPKPPPFAQKTDHELGLMSSSQLSAHLIEAGKALGPDHPYVAKVMHELNPKLFPPSPPDIDTKPPDVDAPTPDAPKYAPGSLDEAVAAVLADDPNATSAAVKVALINQGFKDTDYNRILAAVKRIKGGHMVQGTTGPAQTSPLVPEVPVAAYDPATGTYAANAHPAAAGNKKLEKTFPQAKNYYSEASEATKRAQKRKIAQDISKRLVAKVGDKYDQQLWHLARPSGMYPTSNQYVALDTDGTLQVGDASWAKNAKGYKPVSSPEGLDIIRRAGVGALVSGWAATSNDTRPSSLVMQEAVKGELGLNSTSDWAGLDANTKGAIAKLMADGTYDACRAVARCMYEATQQALKTAGITQVLLFRGVKPQGMTPEGGYHDLLRAKAATTPAGKVADIKLRPISSWAFQSGTANAFAGGGAVFAASVPANRIFSTAMTGFGCLNEHEVVVLGGEDKVLVRGSGGW